MNNQPNITQELDVILFWLNDKDPLSKDKYYLRLTSNEVNTMIKEVVCKIDINTLRKNE